MAARQFPCAFFSARFDGGPIEGTMRQVHALLKERGHDVEMVEADGGQNFGDMTVDNLNKIRRKQGVLVAVCTHNYGEMTASESSTYEELRYCDEHGIAVLPLRVEDVYPPQPPWGEWHPRDKTGRGEAYVSKKIPPSLAYIDCRGFTAKEIAEKLAGCLAPGVVPQGAGAGAAAAAAGTGSSQEEPRQEQEQEQEQEQGEAAAPQQLALACGTNFAAALRPDGSLVQWGGTCCGERKDFPAGEKGLRAVACGYAFAVELRPDGSLLQWGRTSEGQREDFPKGEKGLRAVACGYNFAVALRPDGSPLQWGSTSRGQRKDFPAGEKGLRAVACGDSFAVALRPDGSPLQWGSTSEGQREDFPVGEKGLRAVACGASFAVALRPDGSLVQWGSTSRGEREDFPAGETVSCT